MSVALRPPAYQTLADDLRQQITSGRLRPGDRLPTEPQLCASSGVSRSTVREALRLLASQNLIVTTRGVTGGSFVAHPSPDQLGATLATGIELLLASAEVTVLELLEVRIMLEVPGARLAAARRSEADLDAIAGCLFSPDDPVDAKLEYHNAFHAAIAKATRNSLLQVVSRPLYAIGGDKKMAHQADREAWVRLDREHRAILAAIEAGREDEAEALSAAHLDRLRADVLAYEDRQQPVSVATGAW